MKNRLSRLLALPLLSLPLLLAEPASPPHQEPLQEPSQEEAVQDSTGIHWRTDLQAAREDALKQGKPILYYFRCDP